MERDDGVIELHPHAAVPVDQTWFWTKDWQTGEREVDGHIAAGDVKRFGSGDAFVAHLEALETP